MLFILLQGDNGISKTIPDGEKALLHWIIYILIAILIYVVVYFIRRESRADKEREALHALHKSDIREITNKSIEHISKTNEVLSTLGGVIKENTAGGEILKDAVKEMTIEMKTRSNIEKDYLPDFIKAIAKEWRPNIKGEIKNAD